MLGKRNPHFYVWGWSVFVPADGDSVKEKTLYREQPLEAVTGTVPVPAPVPVFVEIVTVIQQK